MFQFRLFDCSVLLAATAAKKMPESTSNTINTLMLVLSVRACVCVCNGCDVSNEPGLREHTREDCDVIV